MVGSHEDTGSAGFGGALATETLDLAVRVDTVVLEDSHLNGLALVLDLLGGSVAIGVSRGNRSVWRFASVRTNDTASNVRLLLALLGHTTEETEAEVESRLPLDVVVGKGETFFELLSSEQETLVFGGDTLASSNLRLDLNRRMVISGNRQPVIRVV